MIKNLGIFIYFIVGYCKKDGFMFKGIGKEIGWFLYEVIVVEVEIGVK